MTADHFKFIVIGAGRGGTSLLAGLLDYHSEIHVAFELYAVAYLMGKQFPYRGIDLFDKRLELFIAACKQTANQQSKKFWGNKITTEQLFGLEEHNALNAEHKVDVFDAFFNKYLKDIKIIFILRDGRTCINSKVQRTGQSIKQAVRRWKYSVMCYKFLMTCHSKNLCVRFEDLLFQPKETLVDICSFLGTSYQDAMLLGTNNNKMLPEYRKTELDRSKTELIELPDQVLAAIKGDLTYCGYW